MCTSTGEQNHKNFLYSEGPVDCGGSKKNYISSNFVSRLCMMLQFKKFNLSELFLLFWKKQKFKLTGKYARRKL